MITTACQAKDDGKETSVYQSVNAKVLLDKTSSQVHDYDKGKSPEFLVVDNILYLKIQTTYNKNNLYMVADTQSWDSTKLNSLVKKNPEIKELLPDPNSTNGDIAWIKN